MHRATLWIPLLFCVMFCFNVSPSTAAAPWKRAYRAEKHLRRDLVRQQHEVTRDQLLYDLRNTHPSDISQRRALHESLRRESRCYREQMRALARDQRNLRNAYEFGYRQSLGSQSVVTSVSSPTAATVSAENLPLNPPLAPAAQATTTAQPTTAPRIVTHPSATHRTVDTTSPKTLTPAANSRSSQSAVVPASNVESLPRGVESVLTRDRPGEPTPAERPEKSESNR